MSEKEITVELKEIIKTYLPEDVEFNKVELNSNFTTELNINSAHLVDIVLDVEDKFDIILENEDMDGMQTVQDALRIIQEKMKS